MGVKYRGVIYPFVIMLFFLINSHSAFAAALQIQNASNYNFTLTKVVLSGASCVPACTLKSILAPGALQTYAFSSTTGTLTLDYDVQNGTTRVGHIAVTLTPKGGSIQNGLGGKIVYGTISKLSYVPPVPIWSGKFFDVKTWVNNNWKVDTKLPKWGEGNIQVLASGLQGVSPYKDNYIRVKYPAGSANSAASPPLPLGGTQFYAAVIPASTGPVTLSYYLMFPTNFPFTTASGTKVGKLPGLYGGRGNTGTNMPTGTDGWSTRFMWCDYDSVTKKKYVGAGELLTFTYKSNQGLYSSQYGYMIGCGKWSFKPDGKWHNIQQTVRLNDIGKANGRVDVCFDGQLVFTQTNLTFRTADTLRIDGVLFQSFFGGSGAEYATPISTYADFAGFAIYSYPTTEPPGLCLTNV